MRRIDEDSGVMYVDLRMPQKGKSLSSTSFISVVFPSNPRGLRKGDHVTYVVYVGSILYFRNYWSVCFLSEMLI